MRILQRSQFENYLQPRPRDFHKGNAGHVVIVGGEIGYSGAVHLAAEAALRVGAGLVSVATRTEHANLVNVTCPEIMSHGVNSAADLAPLLSKADVVIVGPGLGQTEWSRSLLAAVLAIDKPMIVDADALNLLSQVPIKKSHWILTPHPGEAARLLKMTSAEIQQDRVAAIKKIQSEYGGVCVLKGAGSLVLGEDKELAICEAGNPGMATAGMGDVLSGVIGGLLGQHVPLVAAAQLGVLLHAMAGDLAAKSQGERSMIASDLIACLSLVCR
jgi:ADP-dependent NAD(P)H-hydrate dehydratase / NAD(P)H-hydrate epimerase